MSEVKTIKLKFNDKVVTVPIFPTLDDCINAFLNNFCIENKKKQNLSLFYYDEEGDQISFNLDEDYKLFIDNENLAEKIIEGELVEKDIENEEIQLREPDPMASGHIFTKKVPEQHHDLNLKDSENALSGNNLYSIDSLNNNLLITEKEDNNEEAITIGINQLHNMVNKTLEENEK